jgi:hypothetical protein
MTQRAYRDSSLKISDIREKIAKFTLKYHLENKKLLHINFLYMLRLLIRRISHTYILTAISPK